MTRKLVGLGIIIIIIASCTGNQGGSSELEAEGAPYTTAAPSVCSRYSNAPPVIHFGDWEAYHDLEKGHYVADQLDELEMNCVLRPLLLDWLGSRRETERISFYNSFLDQVLQESMAEAPTAIEIYPGEFPGAAVPVRREANGWVSVWEVSVGQCIAELNSDSWGLKTVRECYILYLLAQESPNSRPMKEHVIYIGQHEGYRVQYCALFIGRLGGLMVHSVSLPRPNWQSDILVGSADRPD